MQNKTNGLTLVEVLVVAPIVMLVIGVFIGMIIYLTGDVISSRVNNTQSYAIQDALDRIEQDVKLSAGYLATNSISVTTPQGYDDGTAAFHNADLTTGTMLILNMYAISKSPSDQTRNILYTKDNPNSCTSDKVDQNTPLFFNIVYFVKNNNLMRRVITPSNYATNNCDPWSHTTIMPWQLPTCAAGYVSTFCKSTDETLVTGIATADGFIIKYFTTGNIVNLSDASDNTKADSVRQTSLNTADMITATINTSTMAAGREVNQSGTVRATKYNPTQLSAALICPTGFIRVPGSETYGTSDFCVMKYEAKADDNGDGIGDTNRTTGSNTWPADTYPISASRKLVSSAAGYPVAIISQTTAISAASATNYVYGCESGCHLISEAEWMTIAQNVLSVPSNWSGNAVGSGYIYSGHGDTAPDTALVSDGNDSDGYAGTGQSSPSNQRRTLTLTNGEVIWDFAGNVWELTSGQMTGGQPTGMAAWALYEWTAISGGTFTVNPYPSGTGISGSSAWNSTNGIGRIRGLTSDATLRGFIRSGDWNNGGATNPGVLTLHLDAAPSAQWFDMGFRVTRQ